MISGKCIGSVVPNFAYNSEIGAAALPITVPAKWFPGRGRDCTLHAYVNGAGFFAPYPSLAKFPDVGKVENLAVFESLAGRSPAVVRCEVGDKGGVAILSSPHIEFAAFEMNPTDEHLMKIDQELRNDDRLRERFLKSCLEMGKLRMKVDASL